MNLTSAGTWRAPVEELIAVGPIKVAIRVPGQVQNAQLLVSRTNHPVVLNQGKATIEIGSIRDHEVLLIS